MRCHDLFSLPKAVVLIAIAFGVLGCREVGSLSRQRDWVDLNPGQPAGVRKAVLGKKLVQGMNYEAAVASWGEPDEKLRLGRGDARWTYNRVQTISGRRRVIEYTLVFSRGVLIKTHHQTRR